jgi:outer membrane protein TolC
MDTGHVYLDYLKQGLALAEGRYAMEKAAGNRYLSFVSVSYDVGERLDEMRRRDDGKDYDLANAYILEAGFRLPFMTEGNAEINRRRAQLRDEKEDYRQSRAELEQSMRKDIKDIAVLVEQYRYLKARENEVDAQASLKKYLQMSGVDPLSLLSIKAAELRNRIKIQEVKYGILRNWIRVLDASGRLSREPLRNWLAADGSGVAP